jgi:uncharacterized protein
MITVKDIIVRKPTAAEKEVCKAWPIWTHEAAQFEWEYSQVEKCLILEGQVTITDRPDSGKSISFGPGDYVIFPNGLKCVWKIDKAVKKHYEFD